MKERSKIEGLTDSISRWQIVIADGTTGNIKTVEDFEDIDLLTLIHRSVKSDWLIVIETMEFRKMELDLVQDFVFRINRCNKNYFIYIIPEKTAPLEDWRFDGNCNSFMTRISTVKKNVKNINVLNISEICYELSFSILNSKNHTDGFLAVTLVDSKPIQNNKIPDDDCSIIISHHGKYNYLKTCLFYLEDFHHWVYLGFDIDKGNKIVYALVNYYKKINCYLSNFNKKGPYGIRHELTVNAKGNLCIFHDSDDVSCVDRFSEIVSAFKQSDSEFIGSHEVRVDEIEKAVKIFRYPLDVNDALNKAPRHCLLFPTSAIRKDAYMKAGGFSNYLRFGLDTQFLLRSHFQLKVRNLDAFLYIRRRRKGSLTTHPKTALGTKIRFECDKQWKEDFRKISAGKAEINKSSIAAFRKHRVELTKIQADENSFQRGDTFINRYMEEGGR